MKSALEIKRDLTMVEMAVESLRRSAKPSSYDPCPEPRALRGWGQVSKPPQGVNKGGTMPETQDLWEMLEDAPDVVSATADLYYWSMRDLVKFDPLRLLVHSA